MQAAKGTIRFHETEKFDMLLAMGMSYCETPVDKWHSFKS